MVYQNPRQKAREAAKLEYARQFKATGNKFLGMNAYHKMCNDDMENSRGALRDCFMTETRLQRWQSGTALETSVFMAGDLPILRASRDPLKIDAKKSIEVVKRNFGRLAVRWIFRTAGLLVRPNPVKGIDLYYKGNALTLSGNRVERWLKVEERFDCLEGLISLAYDVSLSCQPEIDTFNKKLKELRLDRYDAVDEDGEETGEKKPTVVAQLLEALADKINEIGNWIESGLQDYGDGNLREELEHLAVTQGAISGRGFRRGFASFRLHQWADAPIEKDSNGKPLKPALNVFDRPSAFKFHSPQLHKDILSSFNSAEQSLLLLAIGRAALGGYTDMGGLRSLKDWRYAILLDSEPNMGKTVLLDAIKKGLDFYGLAHAVLPNRLEAGFGFGVFASNAVISDDMSAQDFAKLSSAGIVKSAISGATIQFEKKGKDATEGEANAVLFAAINGLGDGFRNSIDDGIKSRVLHLKTKVLVKTHEEEVPTYDKQRTNGVYPQWKRLVDLAAEHYKGYDAEEVAGAYLVALGVQAVGDSQQLSRSVESLRKRCISDLQADSSVKTLGANLSKLTAMAISYLLNSNHIDQEQAEVLLQRAENNQMAIGAAQVALPIYASAIPYIKMVPTKDMPPLLRDICGKGTFKGRDTLISDYKTGRVLKTLTGEQKTTSTQKEVDAVIQSAQTDDVLTSKLSSLQPHLIQQLRTVRQHLKTSADELTAGWSWLCRCIEGRPQTGNTDGDYSTKIAANLLGILI